MTASVPSVAVLGTGTMGVGMVHSMLRAGIAVTVWNRHAERAARLQDDGAHLAESVEDAVRGADIVVTMLFDAHAVAEVMTEAAGAMTPDAVWVQASTVGRAGIASLAAFAREHDLTMLDAPVVGTKKPAEDGALTVLASGPEHAHAIAQPLFDAIGAKTVWLGTAIGAASALKLVANSWIATITAGAAQAIELARALDLDPSTLLEAIAGTAADSQYLQTKGATMIAGSFDPQFALDGLRKDLGLIERAADDVGISTVLLDTLLRLYGDASDAGHGADDIAAVATAFRPA